MSLVCPTCGLFVRFGEECCVTKENALNDPVTRPAHYTQGTIEVLDFIEDQKLGHHAACVVKYVCRYPFKNGVEDLEKAAVYLERLIRIEERKSKE